MAPRKTKSPGKTTRYYRRNPDKYKEKLANDTKENKSKKDRKYRAQLAMKRRQAGRMGKGGKDMCHTKNGIVPCDAKQNRADGARKKAKLARRRKKR